MIESIIENVVDDIGRLESEVYQNILSKTLDPYRCFGFFFSEIVVPKTAPKIGIYFGSEWHIFRQIGIML